MLAIETPLAPAPALLPEPLRLNTTLPLIKAQVAPQPTEAQALPSTPASPAQPWQLHTLSGVPLKLLLELYPRSYRSYDPLAGVRPALALVAGLAPEYKMYPNYIDFYIKAAAFVRAQAHVLFAQPPCPDFDFLQECTQQVKLYQAQLGKVASNWLDQFGPEVHACLQRNPAAHLLILAHLQWQQGLKRKSRGHQNSPRALGQPHEAPWALHACLGLPLLKAAETQHSGPLLTSPLVRVQLKALSSTYLRLEHCLNFIDVNELPQPIVTGVNRFSRLSNYTLLHYQIPDVIETELEPFSQHLAQLKRALELKGPKLWPINADRAWSSVLIQRRLVLQCYDMCMAVYALRHPESIIAHSVLRTTVALKQYGFNVVSAYPELTARDTPENNKSCSKRILGALVPNTVLDLLALSSYVHAQDCHDALLRNTPFTYKLRSWDEAVLDI